MKKPKRLKIGDTIAAISLSSGMAGDPDILWRYEQGKKQLIDMGFNVIELELTLAGSETVYSSPKGRVDSLHSALLDPNIDGIIATIGGIDSYRIFEYLDLNILRENPKIFIGYSDLTSVYNCNFGHTEPKWTLPLGVKAQVDLDNKQLKLLESATIMIDKI